MSQPGTAERGRFGVCWRPVSTAMLLSCWDIAWFPATLRMFTCKKTPCSEFGNVFYHVFTMVSHVFWLCFFVCCCFVLSYSHDFKLTHHITFQVCSMTTLCESELRNTDVGLQHSVFFLEMFFFPCLLMQNWSRGRCTGTPHIFWPTFRNSMEFQSILPGTSIQWSWNHPAFGALSMPQTDQRHQVSLRGPVWMEPVIGTLQPRLGEFSGCIQ